MMKTPRHKFFVELRVEHSDRAAAIAEMEKLFFRLKADGWPNEGITRSGQQPRPYTEYSLGDIIPSIQDRISAIEAEIETRLGGLSEENKP